MEIAIYKKQSTSNKLCGICIVVFICILLFGTWNLPKVFASACTPIYGGGLTCGDTSLAVQTQVLSPTTNHFVHSLGTSSGKFQSSDLVTFQIILTNTAAEPIQNVVVKDSFPSVLTFTDGPGQFNKSTHVLTFIVPTLTAHHSQLFTISGRVVSQDNFPTSNNACVSNQVSALASLGNVVADSSQFCLKALTTTPATGPESMALIALLPSTLLGFIIKRFAKKSI